MRWDFEIERSYERHGLLIIGRKRNDVGNGFLVNKHVSAYTLNVDRSTAVECVSWHFAQDDTDFVLNILAINCYFLRTRMIYRVFFRNETSVSSQRKLVECRQSDKSRNTRSTRPCDVYRNEIVTCMRLARSSVYVRYTSVFRKTYDSPCSPIVEWMRQIIHTVRNQRKSSVTYELYEILFIIIIMYVYYF